MDGIILGVASSIVATILYKMFSFDSIVEKNHAHYLLLKEEKTQIMIYIKPLLLSLAVGFFIDFTHIFRFDYMSFIKKMIQPIVIHEHISDYLSLIIIIVGVSSVVFLFIKKLEREIEKVRTTKSGESTNGIIIMWIILLASHVGYTISLWRSESIVLSLFIAFTIFQAYLLILFNSIKSRQISLESKIFKVKNLHDGKTYHSKINEISFIGEKAIIWSDTKLVTVSNFELELIESDFINSSKYKCLSENVQRIKSARNQSV